MASVTPNMSLTKWTATNDLFNHTQLANNFDAIDSHDHTLGKGLQIPGGGIANGAVGTAQLAANAVTASNIAPAAVGTSQIANNAIGSANIANNGVLTRHLADGAKLGLTDSVNNITRRGAFVCAKTTLTSGTLSPTMQVASTTGFPATGTLLLIGTGGNVGQGTTVTYTGTTPTTFTGCTVTNNQFSNTFVAGAPVYQADTTTSTSLTYLATPDQITSLVVPANAFVGISYTAIVGVPETGSGTNTVTGALMFGATQLMSAAASGGNAVFKVGLLTSSSGSMSVASMGAYAGDSGNPQTLNPVTWVYAPAGTYTVGVQYQLTGTVAPTTVVAANRRLFVWTLGF